MSRPGFDQAVRRLAQYRPFSANGQDSAAAVGDLILGATAVQGGSFDTLRACQDGIRQLWGVEFEIEEIRDAVDRLIQDGQALRKGARGGGFELTPDTLQELQDTSDESQRVEREALADWEIAVRRVEPKLTDEDMEVLASDLREWLAQVFSRHGVEAALILYPENPRATSLFEDIEELGLDFLPGRGGCIGAVRDSAFRMFVREPTASQRTYLADLLNTSFYLTVLTLDPEASALVQERVAGHRVYLDTNFLYALLGLGTAAEAHAAGRLVELTRTFGYQLAVTPWTIEELRTSLRASETRLRRKPLPRRELVDLMTKATDVQGFTRGFWLAYKEKGTLPRDFFAYFQAMETLLEEHEVHVHNEGCVAVDRDREKVDDQLVLFDRYVGTKPKDDLVKEHDVKHRLLVERLRGESKTVRFSNARYWFLTRDSRLPRYAVATMNGGPVAMPFCVASSAWVQVMRAFTARTPDFDQSLVDLLATPYIRSRRGINPQLVEEVVGRVDHFEGATEKLASEVLADTALVRDIELAQDEVARDKKIENAFIVKAKEALTQLEASEARESELIAAQGAAKSAASEFAQERDAERDRAEKLAEQLAEEKRQREEELGAERRRREEEREHEREDRQRREQELVGQIDQVRSATETAHAESERQATEKREALAAELASFKHMVRASTAIALAAVIAVVAICLVAFAVVTEPAPITLVVSTALLGLCAALRYALGKSRGGPVLFALAFVFGAVGTVAGIVALLAGD